MKINFGKTELELSPAELFSLGELVANDPGIKDIEHAIEIHLNAFLEQVLSKFPNPELKAAIKEAEKIAQEKVRKAMEAVRSPRPNSKAFLDENISKAQGK